MDRTRLEILRRALDEDRTIDIVTTGAKSGAQRTVEIWFTKIDAEVFICGTPKVTFLGEAEPLNRPG